MVKISDLNFMQSRNIQIKVQRSEYKIVPSTRFALLKSSNMKIFIHTNFNFFILIE